MCETLTGGKFYSIDTSIDARERQQAANAQHTRLGVGGCENKRHLLFVARHVRHVQ